jgi:gliding motility-associated-like protein
MLLALLWLVPGDLRAQNLPDIPDIIRVSVDHSDNGVWIEWEPSTDTDIRYYHLWKQVGESFQQLFTFDSVTFQYKHMTSGLVNLAYSVVAEDTSGNFSIFSDNVQQAVAVNTEFDLCTRSNVVQWTPYVGWEGEISGYRVYGGLMGEPLQELEFLQATDRSFEHEEVLPDTAYVYYIETVNINGTISLSPLDTVYTTYPEAPSFLILDHVSVLDESTVEIQFTADIAGPVTSFRLMRRSDPGAAFLEVETLWNVLETTHQIQDELATGSISYQYMVESLFRPVDCPSSIPMSQSNHGNNILLSNSLDDQMITLTWTPYERYEPGLAGYLVQRKRDAGDFVDVASLGPLSTQWQEPIQSLINGFQPGMLQYRVIALSNPHSGGNGEQSISNITTALLETHMQIPSAFTPGSNDVNAEFKPVMDFAPEKYLLIVLDRGGRKMFETTDPGEGWDGSFRGGSYVDEAVYVYHIQYTDHTGLFRTLTGNVTVLYP